MERVDEIVKELRRIGAKHGGRTPSQVALNWLIAKGTVPIPGAKSKKQAEENAGALGWSIDGDDLSALDRAALKGAASLKQRLWQHG
jgi:diketogulonate reductase-like aldo/keto reductase